MGPAAGQVFSIADKAELELSTLPQVLLPRGSANLAAITSGRLDAQTVLPASRVVPIGRDNELWLRITLKNARAQPATWQLQYVLPSIDEVTLVEREAGRWREASAGDRVPMSAWPVAGRFPVFQLRFAGAEERTFYLRVRNGFPAPVVLRLVATEYADAADDASNVGFGLVLGALGLLVVSCAIHAAWYRDIHYALYAAFALTLGLAFVSLSGIAGRFIWGDTVPWTDTAKTFFPMASAGVSVWLTRALCSVQTRTPGFARAALVIGGVVVVLSLWFVVSGQVQPWLAGTCVLLSGATVLAMATATARRGDPVGGWILGSHAPLIVASVLIVARMFGFEPVPFEANLLVSVAIGMMLPLLMIALQLRSREQFALQIRSREMASTDALTGLLAQHLFAERVRAATQRFERRGHNAVVIYVRLINMARVREVHGGAVAEQSMIRSAMKVQRLLPDADCIGRVDENTIGVILESETERASVSERCSRLIAHGLMALPGLQPEVVLQFHVAAGVLAEKPMPAPQLQSALSRLLAGMSPRTRRPIRFLDSGADDPSAPPGGVDEARPDPQPD
jgi:GGDEF domain-containing protein